MTREEIAEVFPDVLFADGFDEAILGVVERCGQTPFVVYDADKCVDLLVKRDGLDIEAAHEHFSFNVSGAWVGENTPGFLWRKCGEESR